MHELAADNQLRVLLCEEQSRHLSSNFLSHYKVHSNFFNHQKLCICEFRVVGLYRPVAVSLASVIDQLSKSTRFPGHILLKVKAHEDHVS